MNERIELAKQAGHTDWVMRITADRRIEVNEDVEVTEAAQKVLDALQNLLKPSQPEQEPEHYPHTWGKDGERCVVCGDKDWMGTSCKKISAPQPEQEPVACKTLCELCVKRGYTFCANAVKTTPIYTTPPQRTWVGLDEKDFSAINQSCLTKLQAATSAESILKEKNT